MAKFVKTIQNYAFQNDLWQNGSKIIIGVSGGPDSTCLLSVLASLKEKYAFELHIAHVNYRLRGKDSDGDEKFVKELAKKYGIKVSVLKPKKASYKGNLENSLRDIRYGFFEKLRQELGYDLVAVAHNQDDQAETVLMRILRGSGLNGLSAMRPKNEELVRPLLGTSKKDILAYLKENKLKFRIDITNKDTDLTRNRIRHKLLPYLEKNFNPSIKKTLGEWSYNVAQDYAFVEQSAERFEFSMCTNNRIAFSAGLLLAEPLAIQRQVFRRASRHLMGSLEGIASAQIDEMLKIVKSGKSKAQIADFQGLKISKKGDKVYLFC
ncbi:MAG TPA: tRNA lysidine(34) synthetase TilS [Patescibacteria group bacterium]